MGHETQPQRPLPLCSGKKYKKCCRIYHQGALAPNALALMRSRYSAYAVGDSRYIVRTTHPDNPDYTEDTASWRASIDAWCALIQLNGLEILEFVDGQHEAFVTFRAALDDEEMLERSRFVREKKAWLYVDGTFMTDT